MGVKAAVLAEMRSEPGRLHFRGIRYLLVRPETLAAFQKGAEDAAGGGAAEVLAGAGREGARRSAARLRETAGLEGRALVETMAAMGTDLGWGEFRLGRWEEGRFEIEIAGSPFAEAYGTSPRPVCHLLRGAVAGIGEALFGAAEAVETECAAAGAKACRFECRRAAGRTR